MSRIFHSDFGQLTTSTNRREVIQRGGRGSSEALDRHRETSRATLTNVHVPQTAQRSEWRKLAKIGILPPMPLCIVSFVDLDGLRHSVEVQADGLYEAAVLGLAAFKKHNCQPGAITQLDVEVRSSIVHSVPVHKVTKWLARGVNSPKEAILKERLRSLL